MRILPRRTANSAFVLAVLLASSAAAQTRRSIWDGVFTSEQAAHGKTLYENNCAGCHGADLMRANRPALKGTAFLNHWMEGGLDALYARVKSMPPNRANLETDTYVDVLAFLLEANEFPAGTQALNAAAIADIRVQGKNGPGPVPNFALVDVVGCFKHETAEAPNTGGTKVAPKELWTLTNASEPIRTRNPGQPSGPEIEAANAKPLGAITYNLLDVEFFSSAFHPENHVGHKMNAKGFLIRAETETRLNVTWLEMLAESCGR